MSDLPAFLLARLDEDEAVARQQRWDWSASPPDEYSDAYYERQALAERRHAAQPHGSRCGWRLGEGLDDACTCGYPARMLAEVEAKRAIVNLVSRAWENSNCTECNEVGYVADEVLRLLAEPYANHPGFDSSWLPYVPVTG